MSTDPDTGDGLELDVAEADERGTFRNSFRGRFTGLLEWADVTAVFERVRAIPSGWWIYDTRNVAPEASEQPEAVAARLADIQDFLRSHHRADYCGFVYVDDKAAPRFIKVFDPRNASSCSLGTPLPVYTITRLRPETLPFAEPKHTGARGDGSRGGLLRRMFKGRP